MPQGQRARRRPGGRRGRPRALGDRRPSDRTYLLESIVDPNKQIAQGFESVILATNDGKVHAGVLRGEDDKEVRLITAEGKLLAVPKETIEDRKRGPSAMPGDLAQKLSKTELRDLIEFLASLKGQVEGPLSQSFFFSGSLAASAAGLASAGLASAGLVSEPALALLPSCWAAHPSWPVRPSVCQTLQSPETEFPCTDRSRLRRAFATAGQRQDRHQSPDPTAYSTHRRVLPS